MGSISQYRYDRPNAAERLLIGARPPSWELIALDKRKRDDASFDSRAVSQLSVTVGASVVRQSTENWYPTMFAIRHSLSTAPPNPCKSDTKFNEDSLTTPADRHTSMFHKPSLQSIISPLRRSSKCDPRRAETCTLVELYVTTNNAKSR